MTKINHDIGGIHSKPSEYASIEELAESCHATNTPFGLNENKIGKLIVGYCEKNGIIYMSKPDSEIGLIAIDIGNKRLLFDERVTDTLVL